MRQIKFLLIIILVLFQFIGFKCISQKTLIDLDPLSTFNTAMELYDNEKYSAAILRFSDYINSGGDYLLEAEANFYIAMAAKELRQNNTEKLFLNYLDNYPELSKEKYVYFQIGTYNFDKKKYENTIIWLGKIKNKQALDIELVAEYYFMVGYCNYKLKKFDKSLEAFSQIDRYKNPYTNIANYYEGYIYYNQGKYKESLNKFTQIKGNEKFNSILPIYITHLYLLLEKYGQVIEYGKKALEIPKLQKGKDIKAYMADAYFYLKSYDEAIKYYFDLKEINYNFSENRNYNYAFSLFIEKDYEKAIKVFSQIGIKADSFGQNTAYQLGTAYLLTNDKFKARNLFNYASKLDFIPDIQEISHFNYAKLSYEVDFHKEALASLRQFISKYPKSANIDEAKTLLSKILIATKNYKEALQIIEKITQKNEEIKKVYQQIAYYYGLELFQSNNYNKAKEYFILSLKNEYDRKYSALAYFWLGESYYQLDKIESALREYKNFFFVSESKTTPYYSLGYYNAGYAYLKLENYKDASITFGNYINLEKNNKHSNRYYDALMRKADCKLVLKDYNGALNLYDEVIIKTKQENDYALYQKGMLLGLQNKDDSKINTLKAIIDKYPRSPYVDDAMFEIANMHFMDSKYSLALQGYNRLIKRFIKSSYYITANLRVGLSHYNLGKEDKALTQFKFVAKKYPFSSEAKEAVTVIKKIYIDRGETDKLFAFLKTIPKPNLTKSFQDSAVYDAAFNQVKRNDFEKAIPLLEDYLEKFPNGYFSIDAHYYLARCAMYLTFTDKALEHYEMVNQMSPNQYVEKSIKAAAVIFYQKNKYEQALERFKQLEDISSNNENTLSATIGLMKCNFKVMDFDQCAEYSEKLLNLSYVSENNKVEAQYYIGKSYFELNSNDLALASLNQVSKINNGSFGAEAKYLTAQIYFLKENYDEALKAIMDLKNKFPGNDFYLAKGFILLSAVFIKMGDVFQAKHTLQSIIDNYEGEDIVKIARQKLQIIIDEEKKIELKEQIKTDDTIEVETDSLK